MSAFEDSLSQRGNLTDWLANPSAGGITRIVWVIPEIFVPVRSTPTPRSFSLPTTLPEAYVEFGGPSDFQADNQTFDELIASREAETVRVSNPDDATQFVDVERVTRASFQNPDRGNRMRLRFG